MGPPKLAHTHTQCTKPHQSYYWLRYNSKLETAKMLLLPSHQHPFWYWIHKPSFAFALFAAWQLCNYFQLFMALLSFLAVAWHFVIWCKGKVGCCSAFGSGVDTCSSCISKAVFCPGVLRHLWLWIDRQGLPWMMGRTCQANWGVLLQVPFGHLGPLPPNMMDFFFN